MYIHLYKYNKNTQLCEDYFGKKKKCVSITTSNTLLFQLTARSTAIAYASSCSLNSILRPLGYVWLEVE